MCVFACVCVCVCVCTCLRDVIVTLTKNDIAEFIEKSCNMREMFAFVRKLLPSTFKDPVRMMRADGTMSNSYLEDRQIFREYFCWLFEGEIMTFEELLFKNRSFIIDQLLNSEVPPPDPTLIEPWQDFLRILAHRKSFRGVGEDGIGGEVYAVFAAVLAQLQYPLYVKSMATADYPLQDKGGCCQELHKANSQSVVTNYRDVSLCNEGAKAEASLLRPHVVPVVRDNAGTVQYGSGCNYGCTEFPHLFVKATIDIAEIWGKSLGVIFLDVKTAFISMMREFVFDTVDDVTYIDRLENRGFTHAEAQQLVDEARAAQTVQNSTAPPHLIRLLTNLHTCTWASTEGLAGIYQTKAGCLAGHPLGDIIFILHVSRVFSNIEHRLLAEDLLEHIDAAGLHELLGLPQCEGPTVVALVLAAFVDDGYVPVFADAVDLLEKTIRVAVIIEDEFANAGLLINFSPGKTEVMLFLRGHRAKAVRHHVVHVLGGKIPFTSTRGTPMFLCTTSKYKHLGTIATNTLTQMPDLKVRLGAMNSLIAPLRRKLFNDDSIPLKGKMLVIRAVLLAKGLFHANTWHSLSVVEAATVHIKVMRIYRALSGSDRPGRRHMSDNELLKEYELMAPINVVVYLRIALLIRVLDKAPLPLLTVMLAAKKAKRSWISTVLGNLVTLSSHPLLAELRKHDEIAWLQIMSKPAQARKLMPTLVKVLYSEEFNHRDSFVKISPSIKAMGAECVCTLCEYTCPTVQGLSWHLYTAHGIRTRLRNRITTTYCCCCLQDFSTRERVVRHVVNSSKRCKAFYDTGMKDAEPSLIAQLEQEACAHTIELARRGYRRVHSFGISPLRLDGPLALQAHLLKVSHSVLLSTGKSASVKTMNMPAPVYSDRPSPHPGIERPWLFASYTNPPAR